MKRALVLAILSLALAGTLDVFAGRPSAGADAIANPAAIHTALPIANALNNRTVDTPPVSVNAPGGTVTTPAVSVHAPGGTINTPAVSVTGPALLPAGPVRRP